jgi:hypothetical protein
MDQQSAKPARGEQAQRARESALFGCTSAGVGALNDYPTLGKSLGGLPDQSIGGGIFPGLAGQALEFCERLFGPAALKPASGGFHSRGISAARFAFNSSHYLNNNR